MKLRFILYAVLAMVFQVVLGQLTNMGQGSIGVVLLVVLVELDPSFSFAYIIPKTDKKKDSN